MAIQKPLGTEDMLPDEVSFWHHFTQTALETFACYGYQPIVTPIIERRSLFVRSIGEATDVVSKEMFQALSDENLNSIANGRHVKESSRLALRPEGTAGTVRAVAQHHLVGQGQAPVKLVYAGPMFRAERPQRGRQRQFNQVGVECLGAEDPSIDAEGIIMMMQFYERVGVPMDKVRLLINSMGCENCRPAYRKAVHDYILDHADQMCDECLQRAEINPLRCFDCKKPGCKAVMAKAPRITDYLCDDCKQHYAQVKKYLDAQHISYIEDSTLVRGLDYYTRTVFEVQTVSSNDQNAIGGGGRYDKLMKEIGDQDCPGFGFAIGYERTKLSIMDNGVALEAPRPIDIYVACVSDDMRDQAFSFVQKMRGAGIHVDMDHQSRSLKSQLKQANKAQVEAVFILGPDELSQGNVKLRNMKTHDETLVPTEKLDTYLSGEDACLAGLLNLA